MEEEKKEEKFEVAGGEGPVQKKSKKGLLVAILVIVLIAAIGVGVWYFFFRKESKLQLTEKDKVTNSLNKVENKLDEITEGMEVTERKISKNLMEKPFKANMTITGQINDLNVKGVDSANIAQVNAILNGSSISLNGQGNLKEGKLYGELLANVPLAQLNNQKLGEAVITRDVAAVKTSIPGTTNSDKYYAIFKDSLQNSKYSEYAELFNIFDYIGKGSVKLDDLKFSKDEEKHFKDTYGDLFKKYVTNDKISKEASEVNGKKCDKVTYTIDKDTLKNIIRDYATTFKNDTKGQDILINKFVDPIISTGLLEKMAGMSGEQLKSQIKTTISTGVDQLVANLDTIPVEKAEMVVYATATETYRIELSATIQGETGKIVVDLKDKEIDFKLLVKEQEMMNGSLKNENGALKVTMNIPGTATIELSAKEDANGSNITMKMNTMGSEAVNVEFSANTVVKEDSDNKLDEEITLNVKGTFEGQSIDVTAKINCVLEIVDNIIIPDVNKANSTDLVATGYLDTLLKGGKLNTTVPSTTIPNVTTPSVNTSDLQNSQEIQNAVQNAQQSIQQGNDPQQAAQELQNSLQNSQDVQNALQNMNTNF